MNTVRRSVAQDPEASEPVAHFIPWSQMTPLQQADHLVYAHGFDSEYLRLEDDANGFRPNLEAVQLLLRVNAGERAACHAPEHGTPQSPGDYLYGGRDACQHDHIKEPGRRHGATSDADILREIGMDEAAEDLDRELGGYF